MRDSQSPPNIQSLLAKARYQLEDACKQWQLAPFSDDTLSTTSIPPNHVHPLGPLNPAPLRHHLLTSLAQIRTACNEFLETYATPEISQQDQRKFSVILKEGSNLRAALGEMEKQLQMCKEMIATRSGIEVKGREIVKRLEGIAKDLGLMSYIETVDRPDISLPVTALTIGGEIIVVDIDIDSMGTVMKVKVSFASEIHQDARVDELLLENLKALDLETFKRNLGHLAVLDRLTSVNSTDFFLIMKNLSADFSSIYTKECSAAAEDLSRVLLSGHGIPLMHFRQPGPCIAYWAPQETLVMADWETVKKNVEGGKYKELGLEKMSRLCFSVEEAVKAEPTLPANRHFLVGDDETEESIKAGETGQHLEIVTETVSPSFVEPLRFVTPTAEAPLQVPAKVVVILDPPVLVTDGVAAEIGGLMGMMSEDWTPAKMPTDYLADFGSLSLQEALALNGNRVSLSELTSGLMDAKHRWTIAFPDTPIVQKYTFAGTLCNTKMLTRIPVEHPAKLFGAMRLLRNQLAFNWLFKSCFDNALKEEEESNTPTISIDIQTPDPPRHLSLTLLLDMPVTLNIIIEGGEPTVNVSGIEDQTLAEKLTRVLRACGHVPIMLRWLIRRLGDLSQSMGSGEPSGAGDVEGEKPGVGGVEGTAGGEGEQGEEVDLGDIDDMMVLS
ncbi:uncharacterized protein VTP21DRAFT_1567 [Calcarisporiella thermophila]|uniref:uncharacterized protein n=1 Tax=Calcarisporiella thermophila TaxID=911321 RepID=UPI0037428BB4